MFVCYRSLLDFYGSTMNDVMAFAKSRASRGIFARFLSHKADVGQIQGFRAQLKDALDRFGVCIQFQISTSLHQLLNFSFQMQSHITVRDAVARIQDQQTAILAALQAHAPGESLQIAPSENTPSTFPHPSHSFTSFGNIVNNGEGTFNSINGNYVVNNTNTNTSSTNSRNIMNISTTNSNNRYDLGGIGRANGNTRSMGMGSGPGRQAVAGRRKAEHQPGQRGRRRGMVATP